MDILFYFLVMILILLLPVGKSERHSPKKFRVGTAFTIFVTLLAGSPIISIYVSGTLNKGMNTGALLNFVWIGIAASLPLSIICARAFGPETYVAYVNYLERSGKATMRVILAIWALASIVALAYGLIQQ